MRDQRTEITVIEERLTLLRWGVIAGGLALVLALYHQFKSLDADVASRMKG